MKKIVLLGDSIRKGYDKYVKMAFKDVAEVYYPTENCRFAAYTLRFLPEWKKAFGCGDDVDCVHWNVGLWDSLVLFDEHLTPLEIYKYYIERVCNQIQRLFPKAKVIFATSTPVIERLFKENKRYNKDIELYNAAAIAIAKEHGFEITDLYAVANKAPEEYHSDLTHYYTKEGTRLLAEQVIEHLEKQLDIKATPLDYDQLFSNTTDIIGI